ncbi:MAG: hypothetical protein OEY49_00080 [Candidatus Heimdallarchaeota archaeon]|nr:hypothetical protein [Candidatus Heimdallarchaeota archaeon]
MKIQSLSIVLIIILVNPIPSSLTNPDNNYYNTNINGNLHFLNNSQKSSINQYSDSDENNTVINYEKEIRNNNTRIDSDHPFVLNNINNATLNIIPKKLYYDKMKNYIQDFENWIFSSNTIHTYSNQGVMTFLINNGSNSNLFVNNIHLSINPTDILQLNISKLIHNINFTSPSSRIRLMFEFDTLIYSLELIQNNAFQIQYNQTEIITFFLDTYKLLNIPISIFSTSSIYQTPSILNSIILDVSAQQQNYSMELSFSSFSLISQVSQVNAKINNQEYLITNSTYTFEVYNLLIVNITLYYIIYIDWILVFPLRSSYSFNSDYNPNEIALEKIDLIIDHAYNIYVFKENFTIISVDYNSSLEITNLGNKIILQSNETKYIRLQITLKFNINNIIQVQTSKPIQGKRYDIRILSNYSILYVKLNQSIDFISQSYLTNSFIFLPQLWNKGNFTVHVYFTDGSVLNYIDFLHLSPAELAMDTNILLDPEVTSIVPITFINTTSSISHNATNIKVYENDSLLSEYINYFVYIPGQYSTGQHELFINASSIGFVPLSFSLTLIINEFIPNIFVNPERTSKSTCLLNFTLFYISNFSIGLILIYGDILQKYRFNKTNEILEIYDENWKNTEIPILLSFIIIENSPTYNLTLLLPKYQEISLSNSIALISSIVILVIIYVKYKTKNKNIIKF